MRRFPFTLLLPLSSSPLILPRHPISSSFHFVPSSAGVALLLVFNPHSILFYAYPRIPFCLSIRSHVVLSRFNLDHLVSAAHKQEHKPLQCYCFV